MALDSRRDGENRRIVAQMTAVDRADRSELHYAALEGRTDQANQHGTSPLQLAERIGNYDVARHFADLST